MKISRRIQDEDISHEFGRGTVKATLDVPHLAQPEQQSSEVQNKSKFELIHNIN